MKLRIHPDKVDRVFSAWARLSPDEKQEFAWTVDGYRKAERNHDKSILQPRPKRKAAVVEG